jgi:phosphatidylinositol-4,5-bisphosphate 3-kinase
MLSTGIPELKSPEDIYYLRDSLCLGKTEEAAAQEFRNLIFESLRLGWSTQLNWWLHNLVHSK